MPMRSGGFIVSFGRPCEGPAVKRTSVLLKAHSGGFILSFERPCGQRDLGPAKGLSLYIIWKALLMCSLEAQLLNANAL